MNIWLRIRQLSLGQLLKLSFLFLSRPLLILPTLRATKRAMQICDERFGTAHHLSNQANAFRHALWNVLICQNTLKRTKNKQKSVFWTQKVGELYEKVTQNEPLDEAMDLHNNTIGRLFFLNNMNKNEAEIIRLLTIMTENGIKVSDVSEMKQWQHKLVYIEETS